MDVPLTCVHVKGKKYLGVTQQSINAMKVLSYENPDLTVQDLIKIMDDVRQNNGME